MPWAWCWQLKRAKRRYRGLCMKRKLGRTICASTWVMPYSSCAIDTRWSVSCLSTSPLFCAVCMVLFHFVELRFHVSCNILAQSWADVGDACAGIHDVNIAACLANSLDSVYQFGGDGLHLVLLFLSQWLLVVLQCLLILLVEVVELGLCLLLFGSIHCRTLGFCVAIHLA